MRMKLKSSVCRKNSWTIDVTLLNLWNVIAFALLENDTFTLFPLRIIFYAPFFLEERQHTAYIKEFNSTSFSSLKAAFNDKRWRQMIGKVRKFLQARTDIRISRNSQKYFSIFSRRHMETLFFFETRKRCSHTLRDSLLTFCDATCIRDNIRNFWAFLCW